MSEQNSPMLICRMTRTVIQNLMHFAIAAPNTCEGLLFSNDVSGRTVNAALLLNNADAQKESESFQAQGLSCVGQFHLGNGASKRLSALLSDTYIDVSVSLAEEGRLDLYATRNSESGMEEISLVLIEDGQLEVNA